MEARARVALVKARVPAQEQEARRPLGDAAMRQGSAIKKKGNESGKARAMQAMRAACREVGAK